MKAPRLLQAVLVVAGIYLGFIVLFDVVLKTVIPASLLRMYMFFVIAGVFMVFTFDEQSTRELVAPLKALVSDPGRRTRRNLVFAAILVSGGVLAYQQALPRLEAPAELRVIHPAPPETVTVYGKRFNLRTLKNPLRKYEKSDPEKFRQLVAQGGAIYIRNCQYCHGDKLDGKGPFAQGLNPLPQNFQDIGTIAQLQESFVFWRIATGGPGLPKESMPWASAMPVWSNFLEEEQIWKVILYLYDYTGQRPRDWAPQ